jgi:gluconate 5-dehydrogenase
MQGQSYGSLTSVIARPLLKTTTDNKQQEESGTTTMAASMKFLESLFSLAGKTAVITGGSSGIGREMAAALGQAGAQVILLARRQQPLSDTVLDFKKLGIEAHAFSCDVSDSDALTATAAAIEQQHGGVPDILVNAAGVNHRPPMDQLTLGDWQATMAANLTAPFLLGQAWGPRMARRGTGGRIINIASQQAFRAFGNSGAYGASKGGLVSLTRSQAEAWSADGVLCNAVVPGLVRTALTEATVFGSDEGGGKAEAHARRTMIKRNGVPGDFAGVAVYLASEASAAVTGQTIFVDGGYSAT